MKNIKLTLSALLVAGMLLVSCGGGSDAAIKESANGFIKAMNKMDLQNAKNFVTDSSKTMIDQMIEQMKTMPEDQKKMFNDKIAGREKYTVSIKQVRPRDKDAVVTFTVSDEPNTIDSILLVKENGKWLVDFSKL